MFGLYDGKRCVVFTSPVCSPTWYSDELPAVVWSGMTASGWMTLGHCDDVFTCDDQAGESVPSTRNVSVSVNVPEFTFSVMESVRAAPVKLVQLNVRLLVV